MNTSTWITKGDLATVLSEYITQEYYRGNYPEDSECRLTGGVLSEVLDELCLEIDANGRIGKEVFFLVESTLDDEFCLEGE